MFSRYIIKESFEIGYKLKYQKAYDKLFCFFYVNSLFTNLPPNEVTNVCADTLYSLENLILNRNNFISLKKLETY